MNGVQFLMEKVWHINKPVRIPDYCCSYGFLGLMLLPLLPKGSTYIGIDFTEGMLKKGKKLSHAILRHVNNGEQLLRKMAEFLGDGGLLVTMEYIREFEVDDLYIDGLNYSYLCEQEGLTKLWKTELQKCRRYISETIMEKILLFNLTKEKEKLVRALSDNMRIKVITVSADKYTSMLEDIAEQKTIFGMAPYAGAIPPESLLLFCNVTEKHLNRLLFSLKQKGTAISYKAVLTETNKKWNPIQLFAEMAREKAKYVSYEQNRK